MRFDTGIFLDALFSQAFLVGALLSVVLALLGQAGATVLGLFLAVARDARGRTARGVSMIYSWLFRAAPLMLVLLIIWNALPQLVPALKEDWSTPFVAALAGLILSEAAYMSEILRSAIRGVDDGQRQAGRALGIPPVKLFVRVILPQAAKIAIGPTGNEFISMVKYTSLASVISLRELLTTAQVQVAVTFRYAEYYLAALIYYLVIVSLLMVVQSQVEKRFAWQSGGLAKVAGIEVAPARTQGLPAMEEAR